MLSSWGFLEIVASIRKGACSLQALQQKSGGVGTCLCEALIAGGDVREGASSGEVFERESERSGAT